MSHRVLIVDDERWARIALRDLLAKRSDVRIVGEASSVASAATAIADLRPDIIFLDVQMPDGLGFDLFELMEVSARIVFVTAYDEHALRAFDVNALDYLVKPVDPVRLDRALTRAASAAVAVEAPEPGRLAAEDRVCLQDSNSMKFGLVRDIVYISAADDYSEVHLANGKLSLVSQRLRRWEERLPDTFVRVHRSTLVNLNFVEEIEHTAGRWLVHVKGVHEPLAMSRRYTQALKKRLELIM